VTHFTIFFFQTVKVNLKTIIPDLAHPLRFIIPINIHGIVLGVLRAVVLSTLL
jgi:hypothetical protein